VRLSPRGIAVLAVAASCALSLACGSSASSGGTNENGPDGSGGSSGSSGGSGSSSGGDDGGGGVDAGYPAFAPEMAQVQNGMGPVVAAPKVVTVTWQSDPNSAALEDFDDDLVASSWWPVLSEYGVGAGTSTATEHVVITTAPQSPWADNDIDSWTQDNIANSATDGWPAPDANTIYIVYVPAAVMVTDPSGDPCDGYHTYLMPGSTPGNGVAYGLIMEQCYAADQLPEMQDTTETGSHEIAEAATDPYPGEVTAWAGFDTDHLSWELWNAWQDEIADACEYFDDGYYLGGSDVPYWLSRVWSNASGKAGHNPCVPAPSGPYNNTTPLGLEAIKVTAVDVSDGISSFTTRGWRIGIGQSATVQVGFYSDAPMAPWTVTASEQDYCKTTDTTCPDTALTITPTTLSGQNGDIVNLTIKVNSAPSEGSAALLQLASAVADKSQCPQSPQCNHYMPVVIGTF
jgi:hypothetical protein